MVFNFSIVQIHFVGWISLFFFHFFSNITVLCFIVIVFWFGSERPSGLLCLSHPLYFCPYSRLSSYLLLLLCFSFPLYFCPYSRLSSYLLLLLCLISFCCTQEEMFGKTLVHEFHISCSHTEWYTSFFARRNGPCFGRSPPGKTYTIIICKF